MESLPRTGLRKIIEKIKSYQNLPPNWSESNNTLSIGISTIEMAIDFLLYLLKRHMISDYDYYFVNLIENFNKDFIGYRENLVKISYGEYLSIYPKQDGTIEFAWIDDKERFFVRILPAKNSEQWLIYTEYGSMEYFVMYDYTDYVMKEYGYADGFEPVVSSLQEKMGKQFLAYKSQDCPYCDELLQLSLEAYRSLRRKYPAQANWTMQFEKWRDYLKVHFGEDLEEPGTVPDEKCS